LNVKTGFIALILLYSDPMIACVGIMTNAGYLPRDFHTRFAARYFKTILLHLLRNIELRCRRANCSQLITEVLVKRSEIVGSAQPLHPFYPESLCRHKCSSCPAIRRTSGKRICSPDRAD